MAMKAFPSLQVCGINVTVLCKNDNRFIIFLRKCNCFHKNCNWPLETDSNRRHHALQARALPTELSRDIHKYSKGIAMNENFTPPEPPERLEMVFRLLGNEMVAFTLISDSRRKNWISISVIAMVVTLTVLDHLLPMIKTLLGM